MSKMRTLEYLSSHDGYLYLLQSSEPFTPLSPAALEVFTQHSTKDLQEAELSRQSSQILNSQGCWDLRDIVEVRHASRATTDTATEGAEASDYKGLDNNSHTRVHRSFELCFRKGQVNRYEVRLTNFFSYLCPY